MAAILLYLFALLALLGLMIFGWFALDSCLKELEGYEDELAEWKKEVKDFEKEMLEKKDK